MAQERIDIDLSNPVSEVPNKARSNNKKECSSKPLANIPRIPADNPAMVAQSQKYQLEIEMLRKQIQEKEAYILASKEMEGLVETLQSDINPSQILPTESQSMPAHIGGISITHPCQMTLEQPEVHSTIGQEFALEPQGGGEPSRDYIRRWMNFCRKCKQPLCEEDTINICRNSMQKEILNRMGDIDIRTFDRLNNVAIDIETFLAKYSSPDIAGQRKRHVQILEAAEGEASSSLDKLLRRRKIIPLKEKMQKPYSFPKDKTLMHAMIYELEKHKKFKMLDAQMKRVHPGGTSRASAHHKQASKDQLTQNK
ncbi:hypothetical protein Taro_054623 [Colocasia esculenta]|uniref:Uncharacterized protein n=1 Tax=Colocasia esculenta TaxID=4460 RepID=A0A843XR88_COLES|nr:hypothetical protein [Colocasia esculenta]